MGVGTDEGQDDRERGIADGRACVADIETSGMTEILLVGRDDVIFSEMLVKALAQSVRTLHKRGFDGAAERYAEGFLQDANEAETAPRAKFGEGGGIYGL